MIFGVVGEGGSGKSAIAVSIALNHVDKYDYIVTNIYGFNKNNSVIDIAKKTNPELQIRHFENNSESFKEVLEEIEILQSENDVDEKLKILCLYDECHKSLRRFLSSKEDDVYFSDFFSEHRHFHIDFYFLTQGYKKIAEMYKGEFKAWYLSIDDQFKSNPDQIVFKKMDKDCKTKIGVKRFKKSTTWIGESGTKYKVFDCYVSGDDGEKQIKQGISLFAKRKWFFIIVLILTIASISYSVYNVKTSILDKKDSKPNKVKASKFISKTLDTNTTKDDFTYSDRFERLVEDLSKNNVVSSFTSVTCLYDVRRRLYMFPSRILTQKNFNAMNDLFLFEVINTQIISENVYKYEYLVNSDLAPILDSSFTSSKKTKGFIK